MKKLMKRFLMMVLLILAVTAGMRAEAVKAESAKITVATPTIKTARGGFHPGKGNALPVSAVLKVQGNTYEESVKCRLRILNSKGKYVFQKEFDFPNVSDMTLLFSYQWDGKASKGNSAKKAAGKYVGNGKYRAEVAVCPEGASKPSASKKAAFTISSKAPAGAAALKAALGTHVVYTGYPEIDYMAEQMVKAAGVTLSMSEDTKVQKLYHYMTQNFRHIKAWDNVASSKVYYDLDKLKSKIASFDASLYKKWKKGEVIFDKSLVGFYSPYYMQRRLGTCTENSTCFKILLAHVGVQAGLCDGYYLNRNGTKAGHTWNWVMVGGTKYYYDVDVEIINYGKGQGDYYWYKKSLSASKNTHEYYSTEKNWDMTAPTWQGW